MKIKTDFVKAIAVAIKATARDRIRLSGESLDRGMGDSKNCDSAHVANSSTDTRATRFTAAKMAARSSTTPV